MVEICLEFLRGGFIGEWQLHIDMSCMTLLYFASLSHFHYQKSVYLHLQAMPQIHVTHPGLHKHVMNGPYVIRRNDRFWAVYSTDLAIEEDLMRSLKTSGDLTRGHGA